MNKLKALIFDVDGTLADTERDGHRMAFNRAFEDAGLPWHWDVETYGALLRVTGGKERIRLFIKEYRADIDAPDDLGVYIRELHESKTRHFVALLHAYTRQQSFTGARIVLDQLGEPGSGFTVLSGDAGESTFVDFSLLKRVFAD